MNYYVFYCDGKQALEYLKGTNYVGIWNDTLQGAYDTCRQYFVEGTSIRYIAEEPKDVKIGYLY